MRLDVTAPDGARLAAERRPGTGVPLVLVHGSGGGLRSWAPVVEQLPADIEAWRYARRGFAPSSPCAGPKAVKDDVADLDAVIIAVGGRAHVVGMSYGGTVALHHALSRPHAVEILSLFEPALCGGTCSRAGPDRVLEPRIAEARMRRSVPTRWCCGKAAMTTANTRCGWARTSPARSRRPSADMLVLQGQAGYSAER